MSEYPSYIASMKSDAHALNPPFHAEASTVYDFVGREVLNFSGDDTDWSEDCAFAEFIAVALNEKLEREANPE